MEIDDCANLEETLAIAKQTLAILEQQKAGHTFFSMPPNLKLEIQEKQKEVAELEERLAKAKAQSENKESQQTALAISHRSTSMRLRVSDEHYIERDEAKRLLNRFAMALQHPKEQPFLFNICGIGGVGKTTLLGRLQDAHKDKVDFLGVCFAKTADIETPLKLMRKLHQQARELLGAEADAFTQREQQFATTLFELSQKSVDGKENSSEDARKIRSWFERFVWLGAANFAPTPNKPRLNESSGNRFGVLEGNDEETKDLQEWIQQRVRNHPVTKHQPELQALMLEPVAQLTRAFAESLIQVSQRRGQPLVMVLDTYEKAQTYLNQWLWQYLVEDTPLDSSSVRLVVVGRRPLQADEGWRKLNQDRRLLHETQLQRFDKKATEDYLKQIGILNGGQRAKIYKATQGLPYYLDWVRKQQKNGDELDFSKGNQAIAELLLQGLNSQQQKILQVVACCRWFDLVMIQHLLRDDSIGLPQDCNPEEHFEWLKDSDFIELTRGHYRLDDVARDVFRQAYLQDNQTQFRKTNALLAEYFKQQADELFSPQSLLPDPYEDKEWRRLIIEFLYYSLFGKGKEGLQRYIEQFFIAVYLREPDIFIAPFALINAEMSGEGQHILPAATDKFFKDSQLTLSFGWIFLDKSPNSYKNYKIEFPGKNSVSEELLESFSNQIEQSLRSFLKHVVDLEDGFGNYVRLMYKSLHCDRYGETTDSLIRAKSQLEQLSTCCRPKLGHSLAAKLGDLFKAIEAHQDALECYEKALGLWKDSVRVLVSKGYVLGNLDRYEEALESNQKAVDLDSESAVAWAGLGAALNDLKRHEEALENYQKAIKLAPEVPAIWVLLGSTLYNLDRYEEALEGFQKAVDLAPESANAWLALGGALGELDRHKEALRSFQKAVDLDPKSPNAWVGLGEALGELDRYEEALRSLQKAVDLDPEDSDILNTHALTSSLHRDFEKAIAAIDKAIRLKPERALFRANRGIILARAGRYSEALAECEQAVKQDPKHESGYYAKACYHSLRGEIEQALNNLQTAVKINPHRSRIEAKHNPDFKGIQNHPRFQALVYPNEENRTDASSKL